MTPVMKLITLPHCDEKWLELLLEFKGCDVKV